MSPRISTSAACLHIVAVVGCLLGEGLAIGQEASGHGSTVCGGQPSIDEALKAGIQLRAPKTVESNKQAYELFSCVYNTTKNSPNLIEKYSEALVQLYKVEMVLGMWVEAREHIKEAQSRTDSYINIPVVRETIAADLEIIKRFVGSIEILATDAKTNQPLSGSVLANGREIAKLPMSKPVDLSVGTIQFEISAPKYYSDRPALTILSNRLIRYDARLVRIPIYNKWQFWVGIGGATAAVITGIGLGLYFGLKDQPDREITLKF